MLIAMFAADGTNRVVCQVCVVPLSPRVGCGPTRTREISRIGAPSGVGAAAAHGSKFQNVNFATDGLRCRFTLANAVTVTDLVGCANVGRPSFSDVDFIGLLRVNLVPQNVKILRSGPFAHDEYKHAPRLSVYKHAGASVRRGDAFTKMLPAHAHVYKAPPV